MGEIELHRERETHQRDQHDRARSPPMAGAGEPRDAERAGRYGETGAREIGACGLAQRELQRAGERRHVDRKRGQHDGEPPERAEAQQPLAALADDDRLGGELGLQRPQQQELERETADGEGLRQQGQPAQHHREIAENVEEQRHGALSAR